MKKSNASQGNRSFLSHGAGKGSADRTTNRAAFNQNIEEIYFPGVEGIQLTARGWKKTYPAQATKPDPQ